MRLCGERAAPWKRMRRRVRSVFSADADAGMLGYAGAGDYLRLPCSGIKIKSLSWYGAAGKILHRGRFSPQGEALLRELVGRTSFFVIRDRERMRLCLRF